MLIVTCIVKKNVGGYCLYYWVLLLVNYVTIVAIRVEFYRCGSQKKLLLLLLLIIRGSVSFRVLAIMSNFVCCSELYDNLRSSLTSTLFKLLVLVLLYKFYLLMTWYGDRVLLLESHRFKEMVLTYTFLLWKLIWSLV